MVQSPETPFLRDCVWRGGTSYGIGMLKRISIENLAVVEKADVEFGPGLVAATGETGAGKSVFAGAVALALGARADAGVVRDGAKEARIEAVFEPGERAAGRVREILEEAGLPCEETLVVRRTVGAGVAGRAWANDSPCTMGTLRRLGEALVEVHGPMAVRRLHEESFRREAIDSCGGVDSSAYAAAWGRLCAARAALESLEKEGGAADGELELLRWQAAEFDEAGLTEEDEDIAERHAALARAEELASGAQEATEALGGDGGAADILTRLAPRLTAMAKRLPEAAEWAERALELAGGIQDLSRTVADAAARLDADPSEFAALDERLAVVNRLKRKYLKPPQGSVADLVAFAEAKRARLAALEGLGERLEAARAECAAAQAAAEREGRLLAAARRKAAEAFSRAVAEQLRGLGFAKAGFCAKVGEAAPGPAGCDTVEWLFEPNPGEGARPLQDVASSGEGARVMLAVAGAVPPQQCAETAVFDEIDANVGGETGFAAGARLKALSQGRQVLAITHLAQTASYADAHLLVEKTVSGGRTRSAARLLSGAERTAELARMLGGGGEGTAAWRHAEEMLARARAWHAEAPAARSAPPRRPGGTPGERRRKREKC